jgi:hypothetical protein
MLSATRSILETGGVGHVLLEHLQRIYQVFNSQDLGEVVFTLGLFSLFDKIRQVHINKSE